MGIVKGDKIAESRKLNEAIIDGKRISKAAFWSYAYFVATLRDDFCRFRFSARAALQKLAPRRPDVTEDEVGALLVEYVRAGLVRCWTVDDATFGEWTNGVISGNRYHRTPEPPWSEHEHQGWCLNTAIREARLWDPPGRSEQLSLQLKSLRGCEPTGDHSGDLDSSSSSSSPSSSSASRKDGPSRAPRVERKGHDTWLTPYGEEDWCSRFGPESEPPYGEMASSFSKPKARELREQQPEEFRARWQRFLAAAERSEFARPARFVQGLGQWAEGQLRNGRRAAADANVDLWQKRRKPRP